QKAIIGHQQTVQLCDAELSGMGFVEIGGRYNAAVVTNNLSIDPAQFNKWNPGFDKTLSSGKKYTMRLPKDKLNLFEERKESLLMASVKSLL
ncbi:hypothetical protein LZB45_09475, partial [Campylobacter jejuni]|uniref:hypothetical protein n=1 Tax=Campylobacter jejuni TaxID=197 RepID=UPI001F094BF6